MVLKQGESVIRHEERSFPPLSHLWWFESVQKNFFLLREYYQSNQNPASKIYSALTLQKAPLGIHSLRMMVNLEPVAKFWKDSILMECQACNVQFSLCNCLITQFKCNNSDQVHCKHCPQCDDLLVGSHVLQLEFYDGEALSITIDFTTETMD